MAEPTTVAGLAIGACTVLGSVVAYLFTAWSKERKDLLEKLEKVQASRVDDAQKIPNELLRITKESTETLSAATKTNQELVKALSSLREGIEELPEDVVRSINSRPKK